MRIPSVLAAAALATSLAACMSSPPPPPPPGPTGPAATQTGPVTDLVGASSTSAEAELARRGYSATNSQGRTTYWGNRTAGVCLRVVSSQGKVEEVTQTPPSFCAPRT